MFLSSISAMGRVRRRVRCSWFRDAVRFEFDQAGPQDLQPAWVGTARLRLSAPRPLGTLWPGTDRLPIRRPADGPWSAGASAVRCGRRNPLLGVRRDQQPTAAQAALGLGRWHHVDHTADHPWFARHQLAQRVSVSDLDWSTVDLDARLREIWQCRSAYMSDLNALPWSITHGDFSTGNLRLHGGRPGDDCGGGGPLWPQRSAAQLWSSQAVSVRWRYGSQTSMDLELRPPRQYSTAM